jgi:UDP-N-acetyl-D-mannosaminuronic acid dehydrogenase
MAASIYRVFSQGRLVLSDAASAEMAKLVENAYRDVNIAFANELSLVCDELKLDVWEVIRLANHHPRVDILTPGPGVGGHCIAVDPWFIVSSAPQLARLIRVAREVNDGKPEHVAQKVIVKAERFNKPTIACLGLAYKANVDDLRESPAVKIVARIAEALPDVQVLAAEPFIDELPPALGRLVNVQLAHALDAVEAADIVVLLVEHDHFRSVNHSLLAGKVVYDTRGMWR